MREYPEDLRRVVDRFEKLHMSFEDRIRLEQDKISFFNNPMVRGQLKEDLSAVKVNFHNFF